MDWKLVALTFGSVFMAELGDKTQLATLTFAGEAKSKWSVFLGSAGALVCTSAIAVLAGTLVAQYVNPIWLKRIAGAAFIIIGVWTLIGAMKAQ